MTATKVLEERLGNGLALSLVDPKSRAKHPSHQMAIFDLGQVHEPRPIWKGIQSPVGHLDRQARLARSPDPGQGHKTLRYEEALELERVPATESVDYR